MTKREIGRVSVALEVDGKVCFLALPQDRLKMLMNLAVGLSDNGTLPVKKAPNDFKFVEMDYAQSR